MSRHLPLLSERERLAAAQYAAMKLWLRLAPPNRKPDGWVHWHASNGAVISERV